MEECFWIICYIKKGGKQSVYAYITTIVKKLGKNYDENTIQLLFGARVTFLKELHMEAGFLHQHLML